MKIIHSSYIYENPLPQLRARGSAFPGVCLLPDGRLMAIHQIGEAFESVNGTPFVSFSSDEGRTWTEPRQVFDKSGEKIPLNDNGKPTLLPDGRVMLFGYEFFRENPDLPLGNPETGGLLPSEVYYSLSSDMGETWSEKTVIRTAWHGSTEASAPMYVLKDGTLATPITGFHRWDGSAVSRSCGRLLYSKDGGRTWADDVICAEFPEDKISCYEQRMAETDDGTLVVTLWCENFETGERLNNHVTISTDGGRSFSAPIDTGVHGQAAGIVPLGGSLVMTLHAVRRDTDEPGIYAAIADVAGGEWRLISCERIWAPATPVVRSKFTAEIFAFLKFGQPGGILLPDGRVLMSHWMCEDGVYKTVATLIEVEECDRAK